MTEHSELTHLRKADYEVDSIPYEMGADLVKAYHYARGAATTCIYRHGLFRKDNPLEVLGVALWMNIIRGVAESVSDDWERVLHLSRLVIVPGMPTNAASFMLGQSIKMIKREGRFHTLLTYADEAEGHTGAIYRATNWEYLGITGQTARFIHPDTQRMGSNRTAHRTRSDEEMLALGFEKEFSRKHKFVMHLPVRHDTSTTRLTRPGLYRDEAELVELDDPTLVPLFDLDDELHIEHELQATSRTP